MASILTTHSIGATEQSTLVVGRHPRFREARVAQQPGGWYTDPTRQYEYRYWNGTQWTDQVSTSGSTGTDPNAMDPTAAAAPPAPGSQAPTPPQAAAAPPVQVTQTSGTGFGVIIGVLLVIAAVVVLVIVLMNNAGDDSSPSSTNAPVTTEAPATTEAP